MNLKLALKSLIVLVLLVGFNVQADSSSTKLLADLLSKMQTLSGNFSQLTLDGNGVKLQEMSGVMSLKRPRKFKWHILEPLEQLAVSNGEKIWLYDPDLEQVTLQQLDERFTYTPGVLLSGDINHIGDNFEVTHTESGDLIDFILKPLVQNQLFVSLRVSMRRGVLNDMQMVDGTGQRTNIIFFELKSNQKIENKEFIFYPPDGTDVIEQ